MHVQALEVTHRVQQAHMHLHAGDQSDEDGSICNVTAVLAEVTMSAAATPVPAGTVEDSSEDVNVEPCTGARTQNGDGMTGASASTDVEAQQASASATDGVETAADFAGAERGTGLCPVPAIASEQHMECLENGPQVCSEPSERTASVQHFLAHMEVGPSSNKPS